ncbi:hypothetical protein Tco_0259677 [Tanacetum coccineum]
MELRLQKGSIKATRQKVHDILGIPMGNTKLQDLEQRDANDPFIAEWEEQYSHLQKPTPPAIALQISGTHEADFMFKMNFITLFESTMGTLENGGRVPTKLLKCIKEEDDIAEIDWCDYILDCLCTSKLNWKDVKTKKNFYYGPLTFLCLLYLDSTFFPDLNNVRHRPAIRSWNTMMMRKRIKMETSQRCLGSLEHHGEFDPEEEQNGIDLYKRLDVYIEPLSDRIPVTKEYKEMFNDVEFNLYESSKDEDSDNDSDQNNDNNKDDEEEPMADGKNENERQIGIQKEKENIEDMDKGTEESGSKVNDNGEKDEDDVNIENEFKKVNEKDDEKAVSMDVDDPNEKMKEKEVDKEKVSDSFEKEQQVKSEKEKQYEADKVEKTKDMFKWKKANGKYNEEKQFEAFSKTIQSEFKKDPEMKNMKDLEMRKLFSMHLEKVKHPRAKRCLEQKATSLRPQMGKKIVNPFPLESGMWYHGEPLWGSSELGGYLVVEGLLRIAPLSHATYLERKFLSPATWDIGLDVIKVGHW